MSIIASLFEEIRSTNQNFTNQQLHQAALARIIQFEATINTSKTKMFNAYDQLWDFQNQHNKQIRLFAKNPSQQRAKQLKQLEVDIKHIRQQLAQLKPQIKIIEAEEQLNRLQSEYRCDNCACLPLWW